ncbi:5-formyltetrahydrofolate cyclo-ligase [Microbacterium sp. LRZ72]|uniref:5-formyltetrahydrofolate cyclo-ligase n=1 Tax=Microbacterium sp. LRZ72 TaxID=2942481 RepID=UPI0029AEC143|nr:5-formyltetrahydrofolate cyclo-ligase [Microbacterium sp. LRZ72]MDX2375909.1 5-formyltetrahydrofolate cyclo-ligase [Microbacterium sp. LRZ72]
MPDQTAAAKNALRVQLRERRRTMSPDEKDAASAGLTNALKDLVTRTQARSVSCYMSTPFEPDTRPFLAWAVAEGLRVLLPVSRDDGLLDWALAAEDGHENVGLFGLSEPAGDVEAPRALEHVDLMLIPAAAVDESGMRMGWGRGYFDRALGALTRQPPVYAVVFDHEVLPAVPHDLRDQPVTGVVTPARTLDLAAHAR